MKNVKWLDKPMAATYRSWFQGDDGKTVTREQSPGWYLTDDDDAPYSLDKKYTTKNGSIITLSTPSFNDSKRMGDIPVQFSIFIDADDELSQGRVIYYNKFSKHTSGNHLSAEPGLDIVGEYIGKQPVLCPHCRNHFIMEKL